MPKRRDYERDPLSLDYYNIKTEELDDWQREVFEHAGNIAIRAGRQVGKSFSMAKKVAQFAIKNIKVNILVSASSERQALYLYEKIKFELRTIEKDVFNGTPTMRLMKLKNGSEIYCLPTGKTGDLIRGLTLDVWVPDEAAYIPPQVYTAVTPMLWVSMKKRGFGWIWALSTPCGKQGKFYEMFEDERFKTWHVKSTECERIPEDELKRWKREFTKVEYAQEVLGEFIDEVSRLFPEELLKKCFKQEISFRATQRVLGVDVARYGGDQNAFVTGGFAGKKVYARSEGTTERVGINDTFRKIVNLEIRNRYSKIIIDDAGVGGGLTDFLIEKYRSKILGVNNAQRSVDSEGKKKTLLKHDLYSNAIFLMENDQVEIKDDDDLYTSLASMQFHYEGETLKIFGRHSHLAEAFVRALWGYRAKGLKPFVRYF